MPTTWAERGSGDFTSWLSAREPALHRLATLLTGDPHAGHDLLRPVLAGLLLDWQRVGAADAEHRGRELLLAEHRGTWDRRASEATRISLAEEYDGADAAAWALVESLPARERAIVVVRHHEGLDDMEAGRLLRLPTGLVQSEDREVVTALRLQLDRQRVRHPERALPGHPAEVLAETLRRHGDEAAYVPSNPEEIAADAGRLRRSRRRRTVSATAVAVVVAVAVAAALTPDIVTVPPTQPAPPSQDVSLLSRLPAGTPPLVPFLLDNTYVAPGTTGIELDVDRPVSAVPYRGGFLVVDPRDGTLVLTDSEGRVRDRQASAGLPVADDAIDVSWVTSRSSGAPSSTLHRGSSTQRVAGRAEVAGLLGDLVVYNDRQTGSVRLTDLKGPPTTLLRRSRAVAVDAERRRIAGQTLRGIGVVVDADTGSVLWKSARWAPQEFSPDGRLVVARSQRPGASWFGVLDARTGTDVLVLTAFSPEVVPERPSALDAVWEDDGHLLVLATQLGESAVLRVGLDGSMVRTGGVLPADVAGNSRYRLLP